MPFASAGPEFTRRHGMNAIEYTRQPRIVYQCSGCGSENARVFAPINKEKKKSPRRRCRGPLNKKNGPLFSAGQVGYITLLP